MLTPEEILGFIEQDQTSERTRQERLGQRYYDGEHDILNYRIFYYDSDGTLQEDKTRSNIQIPHPFFTELVDQAVMYMLSGDTDIFRSDDPKLKKVLDDYFNRNEAFKSDLAEVVTGAMSKGDGYMYAYISKEERLSFQAADTLGIIEVRAKETSDQCEYVIRHYIDRVTRDKKPIKRVEVWDSRETWYFVQEGNSGKLERDPDQEINPRPHILYEAADGGQLYYDDFGYIPFFRLDNNKARESDLKRIKPLIDDYDLMASSLSNNLVDFDYPIHIVSGFMGDDLSELQQNLKTKKLIGTPEGGSLEIKTIDIPFEARVKKLELDEKNIYRFGFGLNTSGLKDTAATTNIAIKAAYALLELKALKFEIRLKKFLQGLVKVVLTEVNTKDGKAYDVKDVYFVFDHETMSNAQENAQIELTDAQRIQTLVNTLLSLASVIDNETIVQQICQALDINYEDIKDKLPNPNEAGDSIDVADVILAGTGE